MDDPTRRMTYDARLTYWGTSPKPYFVLHKLRRFPRDMPLIEKTDVVMDGHGNVMMMPPLRGVPCFGIPIAWLRFRYFQYGHDPRTQKPYSTRCRRCNAADACGKVVGERLRSSQEIRELAVEWVWKHRRKRSFSNSLGARLTLALARRGPFGSINDDMQAEWDTEAAEKRRCSDAARKRRERRRLLRAGSIHPEYAAAAHSEMKRRFVAVARYSITSSAPPRMNIGAPNHLKTALVWLAQQVLKWEGKPHGPADIANWLLRNGWHGGLAYSSLRQIVPRHLRRIGIYENTVLPGCTAPIWAPFDPESRISQA